MTAPAFAMLTPEQIEEIVQAAVRAALQRVGVQDEPLLTASEAAKLLGVTARTLRNYEARGMPVARTSTRVVRYRRAEIEAWARSRGNG